MQIPASFIANQNKIISAAVKLLESNYWNEALLYEAEKQAGFEAGYWRILFDNSLLEAAKYFEEWCDAKMVEICKDFPKLSVRATIARALSIRLKLLSSSATRNISSYFMLPTNVFTNMQCALSACSKIWYIAGDESTDFNYYTKRGLLLGVYKSARLFYSADESENHQETEKFIASLLENVINITSKIKKAQEFFKIENIPIIRLFS